MKLLFFIAMGGAVGAVSRYAVMLAGTSLFGTSFPYGTILVNTIGSIILGALFENINLIWPSNDEVKLFVTVGLLGGFTTFSAFTLDIATLMQRAEFFTAIIYLTSSVLLSIGGFFLAIIVVRHTFS